jgi:hypothetical protein
MNENFPTYEDLKSKKVSRIFEAEEIKDLTPEQVKEGEKTYAIILEKLERGEKLDEGIFTGILAAGAGALIGPSIMRAVCKCLGVEPEGTLGKLLTSKLVLASVGFTLGKG